MGKIAWTQKTEIATEAKDNWCNRDIALFHYFNQNGLYAAKRDTDKQIYELVKQGKCLSGAMLAYGTFNDFATNQLCLLVNNRKRIGRIELSVALSMLRSDIEKAKAFIALNS